MISTIILKPVTKNTCSTRCNSYYKWSITISFSAYGDIYMCTADNSETKLKVIKAKNQWPLQVEFNLG